MGQKFLKHNMQGTIACVFVIEHLTELTHMSIVSLYRWHHVAQVLALLQDPKFC